MSEYNKYNIQEMNKKQLIEIIKENFNNPDEKLREKADFVRRSVYGDKVFLRGLIEISNYCKNNCYYCGIQASNKNIERYRLTKEDILGCCETGYNLGFRTFVLQGGEDAFFSDTLLEDIVYSIRNKFPDCAITLSLGEKPYDSYKKLYDAGANRYLLRHETATDSHYEKLHPKNLSLKERKQCLYNLKEIGFQVGAGFMVGSPFQTIENLAEDLLFLKELQPHMVGIGPFIPQKDTVFHSEKKGELNQTLTMISLTRLMLPKALLPSTTALGTIDPLGRELGLRSGANIVMPNLSPLSVRDKYKLYDDKICTGDEAAECVAFIQKRIIKAGYTPDFSRGDHVDK